MNWDEKAADAAIEYAKPIMRPVQTMSDHMADAFHAGAHWQREALLSDESVERAARVPHVRGIADDSGAGPSWIVRAVLTAALGEEREQ